MVVRPYTYVLKEGVPSLWTVRVFGWVEKRKVSFHRIIFLDIKGRAYFGHFFNDLESKIMNFNGNVTLIDPAVDTRWDAYVESHPFGWITHLSDWKRILEKSFQHMKGYYLVLMDKRTESIRAALPLFEVKSWIAGHRLVSIPFATLSDPLVSSQEDMEELFDAAIHLSKELKTKHIEIRTFRSFSMIKEDRFAIDNSFKHHYLTLKSEPEILMRTFHRTCTRQRIARALSSNLCLKIGQGELDLVSFYKIYSGTRKRIGLPPQPYIFFKSMWEILSPSRRLVILLAEKGNRPVAGLILFRFKDRVSAEYAGSNEEYKEVSPNHFLFWEAIKIAYNEGCKLFDFGRTSVRNETLMDFKSRWGTETTSLPICYYPKTICEEATEREESISYRIMGALCRRVPDSVLAAIGNFSYRHLG